MRVNNKKFSIVVLLVAVVFASLSFAGILEQMPAKNAVQEQKLNAELVKSGAEGIADICDLVVPPGTGNDTKARYAISSLAFYTSRPGAEQERKMYAVILADAIKKAEDKQVKFFFIEQLELVGTEESVPILSAYLSDDVLCEPASKALLTIGGSSVEKVFLKALQSASQKNLPSIIHALGQLQSESAVKTISRHAVSKDEVVRFVSLKALANIGDESSAKILGKAFKANDSYEKGVAASNYLLFAERLGENGEKRTCAGICRDILKTKFAAGQSNIPSRALSVLVGAVGDDAIDYLFDAVEGGDVEVAVAALKLADSMQGSRVTSKWVKLLKKLPSEKKVRVIEMLGTRGDKSALSEIRKNLTSNDAAVRVAGINAIIAIDGDKAALSDLVSVLKKADARKIGEYESTLMQLDGDVLGEAVTKALPGLPEQNKVALIKILSKRGVTSSLDTVFGYTEDSYVSVSVAAIRAVGNLGSYEDLPRVVDLMLNADDKRRLGEAGKTVVKLCLNNNDVASRVGPILTAYEKANKSQKMSILNLLYAVGSDKAFELVSAETANQDVSIRSTAIRSLAKWPDAQALDVLFDIASTSEKLSDHTLTLQGYIRLVSKSQESLGEKVDRLDKAISIAKRPNEKKQAISGLSQLRSLKSLDLVSGFIEDDALGKEAELAAMKIIFGGKGDKPLGTGATVDALRKIVKTAKDADVKKKAKAHLVLLLKRRANLNKPPEGFVALFNGKDLSGWKGLLARPNDNPIKRAKLSPEKLAEEQAKADDLMRKHWEVVDGILKFDGGGYSLATIKNYQDFEMLVDWKVVNPRGDSGIYLRGSPQVQIWDPQQHKVGSGGLYNNKKNPSKPTLIADKPIGQWNRFRIKMIGEKVTIHLNDKLVVDNVTLENYWDRSQPIFPSEQIELQCHGDPIHFKNVFICEIPRADAEGFVSLFNGKDLAGWIGDTKGYIVEDGKIVCKRGLGRNLLTENQYSDFVLRFDFKLTAGANNGLGIRTASTGNAAYDGMELQILDNTAKKYEKLQDYQYHGSIYGVVPADETKRYIQKPIGEWNSQEVTAIGNQIKVVLNGETIVDANIRDASKDGTIDGKKHPGLLRKSGHIGFLGHGDVVEFRNIMIMSLEK